MGELNKSLANLICFFNAPSLILSLGDNSGPVIAKHIVSKENLRERMCTIVKFSAVVAQ